MAALLPPPDHWLGAGELQRWQSLQTARRRAQFLAGHWLARQTAAHWLGGHWSDYTLSAPEDAPPCCLSGPVAVHWQGVRVSLSHSGNWVACALAFQPIGVDVECSQTPRQFASLARWLLTDIEWLAFQQLPPEAQQQHFYTQWTLKEAWVKQASGVTPKQSMQSIEFVPGPGVRSAWVAHTSELTLAVYPALCVDTPADEPILPTMQWSEWACVQPFTIERNQRLRTPEYAVKEFHCQIHGVDRELDF
jgi:4'-phosphopantetheinyl transferase